MDAAEGSIVVKAPVTAVYKRWLEFEDYPKFITAIKRVRKLDANHFVALLAFNGKQYEAMLELYGRQTGVNLARKHIGWYTKGLPGSAELRNTVNQQDDPAVVARILQEFYSPWLARSAACGSCVRQASLRLRSSAPSARPRLRSATIAC